MTNNTTKPLSIPVAVLDASPGVKDGLLNRLARRGLVWPPLLIVIALMVAAELSTGVQLKWVLWLSFGIAALSLDFVWGKAGIFSFGQNALFGIGAYAYAITALNVFPVTMETGSALLVAALAAAAFAAILGYVMFYGRVGDVYLAIVTLAVTLALYTIMSSTAGPDYQIGQALLGGFNGMPSVPSIALGLPFNEANAEFDTLGLLQFAICLAGFIYIAVRFLVTGRFGSILAGLRENETRMELLGYDTRRYKLAAFTLGGAIAGLGGGLFTAWGMFINPSVFALGQAALIVIWVIVGGRGSLGGAFLGVVLVQWISDEADSIVSQQTPLILGVMLILMVLLLPGGVISVLGRLARPVVARLPGFRAASRTYASIARRNPVSAQLSQRSAVAVEQPQKFGNIAVADIVKNFGGLSVLQGVTLDFKGPGIYAIIGANGAGKSTLFGVLSGFHEATSGTVQLNGIDVSRLPPYRRARMGMGIKLQVPSLCNGLTVSENLELAVRASRNARPAQYVESALRIAGLTQRMDVIVETLPHGEKQWLEIAMVLAQDPSVILLDEPAAGMTKNERIQTVELIHELARNYTIVVVEHDMSFIRALNAPVAMLHRGKVFRTGTFESVCSDPEVIDAYLGRGHVAKS